MLKEQGEKLMQLAEWIKESRSIVVFTGAGISTESGIPDFRSPGGIWERFDPAELSYPNFVASPVSRRKYWEFYRQYWKMAAHVQPNRAHLAVAALERTGKLAAVITQNIDGLHQAAGNAPEKVLELHGTMWEVRCLSCHYSYPWQKFYALLEEGREVENCSQCGGLLKPATVSFGQSLPVETLREAQRCSINCDLFICIGSSLVVYPAAQLPETAKSSGAKLVIINRERTPLDSIADLVLRGEAGEIMTALLERLELPPGTAKLHGPDRP